MAMYPLLLKTNFTYGDHILLNQYVSDIDKGISRAASDITKGHALSTHIISDTLNRNTNFLAETITNDIQDLSYSINFGLERVANGIKSLQSDFDIAMGKVVSQFEMMRDEMRAGFKNIINVLENRRKTEAREHFRDAMDFYRDGCRFHDKPQWFDDSLRHFLSSVKQYERNPLAHLHIGHIYHYQQNHQNFENALSHYKLCYTYGEADKSNYTIAAQAYFYAGWIYAAVFDDIDEAIKLTQKALEFDPKISEPHYHIAKFYSIKGEANNAIMHLEKAILEFDRNYCIKASVDPDFDPIREAVNELLHNLKDETKKRFEEIVSPLSIMYNNFDPMTEEWRTKLDKLWNIVEANRKQKTYFSFLDGIEYAQKLKQEIEQHQAIAERQAIAEQLSVQRQTVNKYLLEVRQSLNDADLNDNFSGAPLLEKCEKKLKKFTEEINHILPTDKIDDIIRQAKILKIEIKIWKKDFKIAQEEERKGVENLIVQQYRIKKGLCLKCGAPIGFLQKLRRSLYCEHHS